VSVLVIRASKRFAVRRPVTLHGPGKTNGGLMIELSSEDCRISNAERGLYAIDQEVTLQLDEAEHIPGRVRWAHDGFVGIKFARALRQTELGQLIQTSRAPEYSLAC
jgi:hypothetical protein